MTDQPDADAVTIPTTEELAYIAGAVLGLRGIEALMQRCGWLPEGALTFALGEMLTFIVLDNAAPKSRPHTIITNLPARSV